MRKLLLTLSLLLAIVLTIPLLGWYLLPYYAQSTSNLALKNYGVNFEELHIQRPHWNSLRVDSALLRVASGESVSIKELELGFDRRFKHFDIALSQLLVDLSEQQKQENDKKPTLLSAYLPEKLLQQLPELDASIKHFECKQCSAMPLSAKDIELSLTPAALDLKGEINTEWEIQSRQHHLHLSISKENNLTVLLKNKRQAAPDLSLFASLHQQNDLISADIALQLEHLQPLLPFLKQVLPAELQDLRGELKTGFHLSLEDQSVDQLLDSQVFEAEGTITSSLNSSVQKLDAVINAGYTISANQGFINIEINHIEQQKPIINVASQHNETDYALNIKTKTPFSFTTGTHTSINKSSVMHGDAFINGAKFIDFEASQLELKLSDNSNSFDLNTKFAVNADVSTALKELPDSKLPSFNQAQLKLPLDITLNKNTINFAIASPGSFTAESIEDDFGRLAKVRVTLPPQEIALSFTEFIPRQLKLELEAEKLSAESYTLTPLSITATLTRNEQTLVAELNNHKLTLELPDAQESFDLPPYTLIANSPLPQPQAEKALFKHITFRLTNQCGELLTSGELKDTQQLSLSTEREFHQLNTFSNWLDMKFANDIVNGDLKFKLDWNMASSSGPRLNLNLNNAYANGELGSFEEVQLSFSNRGAQSSDQYAINTKIEFLNVGVEISDLSSELQLQASDKVQLDIKQFDASLFGGEASMRDQHWQLAEDSEIVLNIEDMGLSQLVQSQGIEGLSTEGSLSGEIPIHFSADGEFSVRKGTLVNTRDGIISYHNVLSEDASIDEKLKLTLQALENFHYQQLTTETDYQDGNLILRSKVLGNNPDMSDRKIDLNLNTEVGLLASLQAMRLQQGLEARIEEFFGRTAGTEQTAYCITPY